MIKIANVILNFDVRNLCRKSYLGHPHGCPNYDNRDACPPKALLLDNVLDLKKVVWIAWVNYNLEEHRKRMWAKHPNWSRRQTECCLYWQAHVRKQLREEMQAFVDFTDSRLIMLEIPEANGVNVTETMRQIGVELEWPPKRIVRKVGLIGWAKNKQDT